MIRIIEHGKYRIVTCKCGCKFSFDLTDVVADNNSIKCPECGETNTVIVPSVTKSK